MGGRRGERPIRIGISSCLLGERVRFDGGHKRDGFLTGIVGRVVEWVSVCPEDESGMGTPREPMHLVRRGAGLQLVTNTSNVDLTSRLEAYAVRRIDELAAANLSGYVLKAGSPSCGLDGVSVCDGRGRAVQAGRGLFAARLVARFPRLPITDERRLAHPDLRDNFIERVFAFWRLGGLFGRKWSAAALVAFHAAHELTLLAHAPQAWHRLARLVARAAGQPREAVERRYADIFMTALEVPTTRRRHVKVLQHAAGRLSKLLDRSSKAELASAIDAYRQGAATLDLPMAAIRRAVRIYDVPYLARQVYLYPHPKELLLRR
jgi:uncharacterized protein YbbK (DUF523 family)/uncharacterized protein YbgA (DUF1722 family)